MPQCLRRRYGVQLGQRGAPERAAAGRNQQPPDVIILALQTLPDGARFAVHRQDCPAIFALGLFQRRPRHHDGLLVGQRHLLAGPQRGQRRPQPHCAYQRHHHLVNFGQSRHFVHRQQRHAVRQRRRRRIAPDIARPELGNLFPQQPHIVARRQPDHLKLAAESPHDVQRLPPDGSGRTQYYDASHIDPLPCARQ